MTDDGSRDASWKILAEIAAKDSHVRPQRLTVNSGESAASWAGIQAARGKYIATLDADLQNDPADLPKFLEALKQYDCCVCGTRLATRQSSDGFIRVASSRVANGIRNRLSGEQISRRGLHVSGLQT